MNRWKLVEQFRLRLQQSSADKSLHPTFSDPKRLVAHDDYLALFLFGLVNPVVRTMRGLCAAAHLSRVQQEVCSRPISLGSFSETQHVLDPLLLEQVFVDLRDQVHGRSGDARLGPHRWLIQDSTLWHVLPRMHWAVYGGGKKGHPNRAVRLHVSFHLLEDKPLRATVTAGQRCERSVWRAQWQAGDCYVGDRYFGEDYQALAQLEQKDCRYVIRLRDQAVVHAEEEIAVTEVDRAAGVGRQAWVHMGCQKAHRSGRVRLVWVQTPKEVLLIVTQQSVGEMSAELVALLYRYRWQVELFFRWIKCILGNRHWLAESQRGVTVQVYLALIAALLLQLYTGRRPTKRMMEWVQMYLLGWASEADVEAGLKREVERRQKIKP